VREALVVLALVTGLCGCGGVERESAGAPSPPPKLAPVRLPAGELPGRPLNGRFTDHAGQTPADVREVIATGEGQRRVALVLGRGDDDRLCFGVLLGGARDAQLDCLADWENPPWLALAGVGGDSRRTVDWLAVVGLFRDPVTVVAADTQSSEVGAGVRVATLPGLGWRAFATGTTTAEALANRVEATAADGTVVDAIDLGWIYNPPCRKGNEDVCADTPPPPGPWSETRDAVLAASGSDADTAAQVAFADPDVRRLAVGRLFALRPTTGWYACSGEKIGAVLSLAFFPHFDYEGEIPLFEQQRQGEPVAYRTGRALARASGVGPVDIWVDLRSRRVVGIDLQGIDPPDLGDDVQVSRLELDVIEEPEPAGGEDEPCPEYED
jgi:hypothetical protein